MKTKSALAFLLLLLILSASAVSAKSAIYSLKPALIEDSNFAPALVLPCWDGVINEVWPQMFAHYMGQQGTFEVERNVTKHGQTMLLVFNSGVLSHTTHGSLERVTIEYQLKRNCNSTFGGFGNFTR